MFHGEDPGDIVENISGSSLKRKRHTVFRQYASGREFFDKDSLIYRLFPEGKPQYDRHQRKWLREALFQGIWNGYVHPFSDEELQETVQDVSFSLWETLFSHYWEQDSKLSWEEFLSLAQGREDITAAAKEVLDQFPLICRPDLDSFDQLLLSGPSRYDYVSRKDLIPEGQAAPPLIASEEVLEAAVYSVLYKLEISLYLNKRRKHRRLDWVDFFEALDAEPVLTESLVQQTRWLFSINTGKLKALWECKKLVYLPPLRLT